jgi:hypothetical protein
LCVVLVAVIATRFISKKIEHIADSVILKHRLEGELNKRAGLVEKVKHDATLVGKNDVAIDAAFVSSENILEFVNVLDAMAAKKSIKQIYNFETPALSAISAPFPIATIAYSDTLTTTVASFSDYLKEFENLPYFTKIDGFTIASQNDLGWEGESTVSYRATFYTKAVQ